MIFDSNFSSIWYPDPDWKKGGNIIVFNLDILILIFLECLKPLILWFEASCNLMEMFHLMDVSVSLEAWKWSEKY